MHPLFQDPGEDAVHQPEGQVPRVDEHHQAWRAGRGSQENILETSRPRAIGGQLLLLRTDGHRNT